MAPTGDADRVLHVHPTRSCNLRCEHCYSLSGPRERQSLGIDLLRAAVADAAEEGYNVLSVSGGEPLLYRDLDGLLGAGRAAGMLNLLVTNGMLLDARRAAHLAGEVDLVAVSLDGRPERHDRMRGSSRAFEGMLAGLGHLREAGIPFGLVFTLTEDTVCDLPWAAELARAQGARLLQVHPLEEVGRAAETLPGQEPDAETLARAWLAVSLLRVKYGDALSIQLDVVDGDSLRGQACSVYAGDEEPAADAKLADLVSPLVITETGLVLPLQHDVSAEAALGSLHAAPLRALAAAWAGEGRSLFVRACRRAFAEITAPSELPFANWYRVVGRTLADEHRRAGGRRRLPVRATAA